MNADDLNELRTLFAAMSDGTITSEKAVLLETRLAASAEARRLWFLHCDIETGLADWAAARHELGEAVPFAKRDGKMKPARHGYRGLAAFAAASAFIMLLGVWWAGVFDAARVVKEAPATTVAVLTRGAGVIWEGDADIRPGTALAPSTLHLKAGAAQVEFYSGARVIVEGPAQLELLSTGEAFLHSGKINAHVPPLAKGFTIFMKDATVVDYGTDFGISVSEHEAPEVHVFTGRVEVETAHAAPRSLTQGEAVKVEARALQPMPAKREEFLSEAELVRRDASSAQQRVAQWRAASESLDADPACMVHYTFDAPDPAARTITNHTASATPNSHASVVGCRWTGTGRWPGRRALEFRSEGDRLRFHAQPPAPLHAVTLLAWVRVEALPRWQHVLMAVDTEEVGALRWHLTQRGELRLEIARDLGRSEADWEAVNSEPYVTPERLGRWTLLVTTFDGSTIRHYANGQPIGSGASFTPPALQLGTVELGNWRGGTQRQLAAAMDEFAILGRVMSDAEVRALYEAGH